MRITHIETIRAERQPSLMFVQVHTDAGITGLGETCVGVAAVEAYLHETAAPDLIGSDPRDIARAWTAARSQFIGFGGSSVAVRATSAVDIGPVGHPGQGGRPADLPAARRAGQGLDPYL